MIEPTATAAGALPRLDPVELPPEMAEALQELSKLAGALIDTLAAAFRAVLDGLGPIDPPPLDLASLATRPPTLPHTGEMVLPPDLAVPIAAHLTLH